MSKLNALLSSGLLGVTLSAGLLATTAAQAANPCHWEGYGYNRHLVCVTPPVYVPKKPVVPDCWNCGDYKAPYQEPVYRPVDVPNPYRSNAVKY